MAAHEAATARQPEDPLLGDQEAANMHGDRNEEDNNNNARGSFSSWLPFLGFLFLTLNSAVAVVRSRGETMAVAFITFSYVDLVALFVCLRMYERARAGSSTREWLKIAVWVLTTLLTLGFSYRVAAVMPAPVALLVWLMAFATVTGGFVAFFVLKEK